MRPELWGDEKRGERRIKTEHVLTFRLAGRDEDIAGRTSDVSFGGLCLFTADKLPVGASLEFTLPLAEPPLELKFAGRVVHISEAGEDGYYIGIEYDEMDAPTRENMRRHISSIDIVGLLTAMMEKGASDLHLSVGRPPLFRIQKELFPMGTDPLSRNCVRRMIYSVMDAGQISQFEFEREANFALTVPGIGRWRVNVHCQQGVVEATYRAIDLDIKPIKRLGLPPVVADLARLPDGLVIVAGPTGVGKSTTLAAMIDLINKEFRKVIITLEDPIEFIHQGKRSVIKQREVGADTRSFDSGLKNLLRQDPDVIFIGEIRDRHTLSVALTAAETGHLVLTSLHTSNAMQTIHRILGLFPPDQRQEAAVQLSAGLRGIICQRLLPRIDISGLVVATEILVGTSAVRAVIRDMKINQIPTLIQTGSAAGMHSMDSSLGRLVKRRIISADVAHALAENAEAVDIAKNGADKHSITGHIPAVS
jgi:twitching motility protein PilT